MKLIPILGGAIFVFLPFGAIAEDTATCPLTYDQFEVGVPHTDLDICPASMASDGTYCRLSLVAEVATVFAFSEDTDCIQTTESFFDDAFELTIN